MPLFKSCAAADEEDEVDSFESHSRKTSTGDVASGDCFHVKSASTGASTGASKDKDNKGKGKSTEPTRPPLRVQGEKESERIEISSSSDEEAASALPPVLASPKRKQESYTKGWKAGSRSPKCRALDCYTKRRVSKTEKASKDKDNAEDDGKGGNGSVKEKETKYRDEAQSKMKKRMGSGHSNSGSEVVGKTSGSGRGGGRKWDPIEDGAILDLAFECLKSKKALEVVNDANR